MNLVAIQNLPIVNKIIQEAEKKIKAVTGTNINLIIKDNPIKKLSETEMMKMLAKELVCMYFNITWTEIQSNKRIPDYVEARHAYMYVMTELLGQSVVQTGRDVNRDHTTVISARDKIIGYYKVGDPITAKIDKIKTHLIDETKTVQNQTNEADA